MNGESVIPAAGLAVADTLEIHANKKIDARNGLLIL
jgi:hypothetical protein